MNESEARRTVERLRVLLARGATLDEAAGELGHGRSSLFRLAAKHDLPRPRRKMPEMKRRKLHRCIRGARGTLRRIAELVQVSSQTVWAHQQQIEGPRPKRVAAYICRGCRSKVNLRPCQICEALAVRNSQAPPEPSAE